MGVGDRGEGGRERGGEGGSKGGGWGQEEHEKGTRPTLLVRFMKVPIHMHKGALNSFVIPLP